MNTNKVTKLILKIDAYTLPIYFDKNPAKSKSSLKNCGTIVSWNVGIRKHCRTRWYYRIYLILTILRDYG
jgi:hypothetical protein